MITPEKSACHRQFILPYDGLSLVVDACVVVTYDHFGHSLIARPPFTDARTESRMVRALWHDSQALRRLLHTSRRSGRSRMAMIWSASVATRCVIGRLAQCV